MARFVSIFCIAQRCQLDIAFAASAATIRRGRERPHRVTPSWSTAKLGRQPGRKFQDITIQLCGKWDPKYEAEGICSSITWPRCRAVTLGTRADGSKIEGAFPEECALEGREFAEGFDENIEYFRLDFLDPNEVARGDAFKAILPIVWMIAGCRGEREDSKGSSGWFIPKRSPFAVLIKEKDFRCFREKLAERPDVEWLFLVTDSEENFALMRRTLGRKYKCVQLYKSYLENFRINTQDALNG